ncbi:MAG: D-glycero-beta-D-manno-heptose-7-phosphate kinase [Deltaproteobacteria bacterium]|nr:D-glycero-beta-D-manno-heptose-7-phosphate kinase [Deltaproteobacteria bacterium]
MSFTSDELIRFIERARKLKLLLIGDFMVDCYLWGETNRISPEAPVPVVSVSKEERTFGGAGNVLKNLIPYEPKIVVVTIFGKGAYDDFARKELTRLGVPLDGILTDPDRPVGIKTRVLAGSQHLLRIDREKAEAISPQWENQILKKVDQMIDQCDVVLASDYGKGILTPKVLSHLIKSAAKHEVPLLIDPKGYDYKIYRGCFLITPNTREAEQAVGFPIRNESDVEKAGRKLLRETGANAILITRGKEGMTLFERNTKSCYVPAMAKEVFDVTGAGDTVLAFLGLGIGMGFPLRKTAELANTAAGIVVGKLGAATATPNELIESTTGPNLFHQKIKLKEELSTLVQELQKKGKRVVFTNGCFDLIHPGHLSVLEKAKGKGDVLIVGLNSDQSVKKLKGNGRPIQKQQDRAQVLSALAYVDYVTIFDELTPDLLIRNLRPDLLVKGGDYDPKKIVGSDFVRSIGGSVETVPFIDNHSTSEILGRIQSIQEEKNKWVSTK